MNSTVRQRAREQRHKVLHLLDSYGHLDADSIFRHLREAGETTGLGNVYRLLRDLEAAGLVVRRFFDGVQALYELTSERAHNHLVCIKCHRIQEFQSDAIDGRCRAVAAGKGYRPLDQTLTLYGLCRTCRG